MEDIGRKAEAKEAAKRAALLAAETGRPLPSEAVTEEEKNDTETIPTKSAPPWLASTIVHLLVLLVLALVTSPAGTRFSRIFLDVGFSEREAEADLTEFTIEASEELTENVDELVDSPAEIDTRDIFELAEPTPDLVVAPAIVGVGAEPINIAQPMFNGRTGAMKSTLLAIYGGTPVTEDAKKLGLAWLKRNQNRAGYWSLRGPYDDGAFGENRCAATAMALLAFVGDGNTHQSGEYKKEVEKGVKYLVKGQSKNGLLAGNTPSHQRMYSQAQATIVLCELYGMTKDSWLRPRAQAAVKYAEASQSPEGGWRYEPRDDSDTSVTGWFVMALKSAQSAGLDVNDSKLRLVDQYLDSASDYGGAAYAYQPRRAPSPAMTAEGLLCRQYLGWDRDHPPMQRGIDGLLLEYPFDIEDKDVYYWYYATQTLHHFGGDSWKKWNEKMRVQLPAAQVKRGREAGSWAPQGDAWGTNAGRLYTTCLSIYCLEVYFRHMPLYKSEVTKQP